MVNNYGKILILHLKYQTNKKIQNPFLKLKYIMLLFSYLQSQFKSTYKKKTRYE